MRRTQRLRDPVHGLIVFAEDERIDQLAWDLLDTPEFQRLRRIKQLGVSEFVFPGACHTRFAHCVGVFHTARELTDVVWREIHAIGEEYDNDRAEVAVIAALLHDLGHGPFSHTFEGVQKSRGVEKHHEEWTAEIILNPNGKIKPLLDDYWPQGGFCEAVAELLGSEDPKDIYHSIVSSSFDADRLDYLRRDRLMTGTGAGAIDFDWLIEHVRVRNIRLDAAEAPEIEDDEPTVPTFCIDLKALPAAEQFLLARYTLHEQVYFHKTTRCVEAMIAKLLRMISVHAQQDPNSGHQAGLENNHPLFLFFTATGNTIENYLALDDSIVMAAMERMGNAADVQIADLAKRLRARNLYKTLDVCAFGSDEGRQRLAARRIDRNFSAKIKADVVLKDEGATLSIYTQIGGDDEKAHKKMRILDGKGTPVEITGLSKIITALISKRAFTRYYFSSDSDRDAARAGVGK